MRLPESLQTVTSQCVQIWQPGSELNNLEVIKAIMGVDARRSIAGINIGSFRSVLC